MQGSWSGAALALAGAAAVAAVVSIAACQILMGMALVALVVSRQGLKPLPFWIPFTLFAAGTLASLALSGNVAQGWPQVKKFYVWLMPLLVVSAVRTAAEIRVVALGWAAAASLSGAWSAVQFADKYQQARAAHASFYASYVGARITGFMSHWMTFSGLQMMVLLVVAALLFFSPAPRWRAPLWAAAAMIGSTLALAFTRSMWLGAACGGLYLLWYWRRRVILALPPLLAAALLANPFDIRERLVSAFQPHGEMDSNAHRAVTRRVGWEMIKAHPWFGLGPEQVGKQFQQYVPADVARPLPPGFYGHLHNIYFHYAAERGLLALAALLWMLGKILFDFTGALRKLPAASEARWVLRAAIAVVIATLVSGYFELNLGDSEVLSLFLAVVGCGYVACREASAA